MLKTAIRLRRLTVIFPACVLWLLAWMPVHAEGEACGKISIASMNWPSAQLIAEIDKLVLSAGYGCEVELVPGDTLPIITSMIEESTPDLVPELWVDSVRESYDAAVYAGDVIFAAEVFADGAEQGWWIPSYMVEFYPFLKTPDDALSRPDLFPSPDDESRGAIYNCPSSWKTCHVATANLFKAYQSFDKGFDLIDSDSAAGLDGAIASAHRRELGWLGYYWAPTSTLGRYEMVKLDMGEHDDKQWQNCTSKLDCDNPEINAWSKENVYSAVTDDFARRAGEAMQYINNRQWDNMVLSRLLAWMEDNQASGEEAAVHFLSEYQDMWQPWVSANVRAAVKSSL